MVRAVLGFIVGALVWLPVFFLIARADTVPNLKRDRRALVFL